MAEPTPPAHPSHAELRAQAAELRLHGLLAHWDELMGQAETEQRVRQWLSWESTERIHRSLERRLREAHLGRFKPIADFDWSWPKQCDRGAIEELMSLEFLADASSVVLCGPNGVGKTMVAINIGHQAVLQGHTALFTTAGQMLSELAALDSDSALRRRLQHYAAPDLLLIDEVGYLSYSNRHADMLFELISRRYLHKSTLVATICSRSPSCSRFIALRSKGMPARRARNSRASMKSRFSFFSTKVKTSPFSPHDQQV